MLLAWVAAALLCWHHGSQHIAHSCCGPQLLDLHPYYAGSGSNCSRCGLQHHEVRCCNRQRTAVPALILTTTSRSLLWLCCCSFAGATPACTLVPRTAGATCWLLQHFGHSAVSFSLFQRQPHMPQRAQQAAAACSTMLSQPGDVLLAAQPAAGPTSIRPTHFSQPEQQQRISSDILLAVVCKLQCKVSL
jgi:hypothetical protein